MKEQIQQLQQQLDSLIKDREEGKNVQREIDIIIEQINKLKHGA